jgi:TolB-like protein/Tfp pilus assembly protein PilF
VAVAYAVVAWLLIQAASIVLPTFEAPGWTMKVLLVALSIGFPLAVVLAWAFEITPEGIKREKDVARAESITAHTGHKLIGITVALAVIAAGLLAYQSLHTRGSDLPAKSIAVLPFENLSEEKANAYFASGMQDEILTKLAQLGDLKVISRASATKYQSHPEDLRTVGRQLGVATVLEGSVQRAGDDVLINVQLIDVETDHHLWAQSYKRALSNIFEVEAEVAEKVAAALKVKLAPAEKQRLATAATTNLRAHELYLRARALGAHSDERSLEQQIALLREALTEDPNYSIAWAELASAHVSIADAYRAPLDVLPPMRHAAQMAVKTDEQAGAGHIWLGAVALVYDRDFPLAKRELERAIALDPNSSDAQRWYGWYLARVEKDFIHARAQMALSRTLDPRYTWPLWWESAVAIAEGDYTAALRSAEHLIEIDPHFFYDVDPIAHVYLAMGRWQDAVQRYQSLPPSTSSVPNFELAVCYAHLGDTARARQILGELENRAHERYVDKIHLAAIYAALSENDKAFAALEQSAHDRSARISAPRFYPWLSPLFNDPRFAAFEDKIARSAIVSPAESAVDNNSRR